MKPSTVVSVVTFASVGVVCVAFSISYPIIMWAVAFSAIHQTRKKPVAHCPLLEAHLQTASTKERG